MAIEKVGRSSPISPQSQELLRAIRRIIRCIDLHSRQLMRRFGLTGPQLVVLQEISARGEPSAGELAHFISLSQATVAVILDRLQERGFVKRQRDPADGRRVLVRATPQGEQLLRQAPPLLQESFLREYERLQDWEQSWILSSFQRVVSMMDASRVEATPMLATGQLSKLDAQPSQPSQLPGDAPISPPLEGTPKS